MKINTIPKLASLIVACAALIGALPAQAQRPASQSVCDFYTTAIFTDNTPANQKTLLTLLVNTVIIGNYSPAANPAVHVPGILASSGGLAKYFNGAVKTTNRNNVPTAVNFLDGGGAAPLLNNTPAIDMTSNQYILVTHLYTGFGALLGCSQLGKGEFENYEGVTSMFEVHKFMGLTKAEMDFFITQVALAAQSFGVAASDITAVGRLLESAFNQRCSAPAPLVAGLKPELQSICTAADCPLAPNANCELYARSLAPTATTAAPSPSATGGASPISPQRPANQSICDYYTTITFKENTPQSQKLLLTLLVNTVIIGNYSPAADPTIVVPGILSSSGGLAKYFNGAVKTTNRNDVPTAVNFLDGGGATPLRNNTPAIDVTSNQYILVTHLYTGFGALLGCSQLGKGVFENYGAFSCV
ncbi:hypothetical protein HDU93_001161 [Gonapodya sp. JEL0774]|nr:hypothetical protein HDU93_001161 [Gonapodya sp. JEL0774]